MAITLDNLDKSLQRQVITLNLEAEILTTSKVVGFVPYNCTVESIKFFGVSVSGAPSLRISTSRNTGIHTTAAVTANASFSGLMTASNSKDLVQNDMIMVSNTVVDSAVSGMRMKLVVLRTVDLEDLV